MDAPDKCIQEYSAKRAYKSTWGRSRTFGQRPGVMWREGSGGPCTPHWNRDTCYLITGRLLGSQQRHSWFEIHRQAQSRQRRLLTHEHPTPRSLTNHNASVGGVSALSPPPSRSSSPKFNAARLRTKLVTSYSARPSSRTPSTVGLPKPANNDNNRPSHSIASQLAGNG